MAIRSIGGGGGGGAAGPKGDTGDAGPSGPPNTLVIGTVTNGSAGASITGTAPNQTLNLVLPQGIQGIQGIQGLMLRSGPGAPSNALGQDGEFYIRTDVSQIYGPKASGTWPAPVSLVGATGTNGLGWSARALKTSDQTLIGTAFTTITGLDLALLSGSSYQFEFGILADADATTTGIDVSVTGPASPTQIEYECEVYTSATAKAWTSATAYDANPANANSAGTARRWYKVRGIIRNGINAGNLSARIKREAVGTGPNVRAGSYGLLVALT